MEGRYRGSLLNFFKELSGKQSLQRTTQRNAHLCGGTSYPGVCISVRYLMKTKSGFYPGIFLVWSHQFKSASWQPRM
jgi:hypothetical protein